MFCRFCVLYSMRQTIMIVAWKYERGRELDSMGIFIELVNEMNARRAHGEAAVRRATEELRAAGK